MQRKTAAIINIGYELTTGKTLNTHAQYLSTYLNIMGYHIQGIIACADIKKDISDALKFYSACDLILLTGGLGPTVDDLTRDAISEHYNLPLIQNENARIKLKSFFAKINQKMPSNNLKQAMFPSNTKRIINEKGTADAFYLDVNKQLVFALPGPPKELRHAFDKAIPLIHSNRPPKIKTIKIFGVGESSVDKTIGHLLINNEAITSGIYAENGEITVRFLQWSDDKTTQNTIQSSIDSIKKSFKEYIFANQDISLPNALLKSLKAHNMTISFAESCTGGLLAKTLTDLSGASCAINGSVVTYSNDVKRALLGVSKDSLKAYGAVSKEICSEMLSGITHLFNADVNIAVTGIAGPGGGTPTKPVGLVYIGLSYKDKTYISKHFFNGDRKRIRQRTMLTAYFDALKLLENSKL